MHCLLQVEKPISKDIRNQHVKGKVKSQSLKYIYIFLDFSQQGYLLS